MAHAYLLSARAMSRLVDAAQVSEPLRERLRFSVMQWVDALSPSNFLALNPDAQQSIVESAGRALTEGVANLLGDVKKGRITQTDESQFEIGRNVAVTPGEVVFENRLIQLIQYAPDRDRARASAGDRAAEHQQVLHPGPAAREFLRPARGGAGLYGVPGFLAQPGVQRHRRHRSRHLVRLPGRRGAASAARASDITKQPKVNALGFCVGGTMLASALALAEARGEHPVASLTLLTTLLDFHDTGVLKVFVDEAHALLRDHQFGSGGLMPGRDLATTFSFLRPNELVWNYVVGNYLKGQKPPAFDLLFWNGDSTNPGRSFPGTSATPTWKTISRCRAGRRPRACRWT